MGKYGLIMGLLAMSLMFSVSGCQEQIAAAEEGKIKAAKTEEIKIETTETESESESGNPVLEIPLTEPPEISLTDSLSSTSSDSFTIFSGNYSWNYKADKLLDGEEVRGIVACGVHPLELDEEKAEKMYVPDYNQMEGAMYTVSCPVMPDRITVTGWDRADLGDLECPAKEMTAYESSFLIQLKTDMVYELKAIWEEDKLADRGFSGEASYLLLTGCTEF